MRTSALGPHTMQTQFRFPPGLPHAREKRHVLLGLPRVICCPKAWQGGAVTSVTGSASELGTQAPGLTRCPEWREHWVSRVAYTGAATSTALVKGPLVLAAHFFLLLGREVILDIPSWPRSGEAGISTGEGSTCAHPEVPGARAHINQKTSMMCTVLLQHLCRPR